MTMDDAPIATIQPLFVPPACSRCRFAVREQADLTCHRSPPGLTYLALPSPPVMTLAGLPRSPQMGITIQAFSGFPIVRGDQWCGEYSVAMAAALPRAPAA